MERHAAGRSNPRIPHKHAIFVTWRHETTRRETGSGLLTKQFIRGLSAGALKG
jgi:hypothetical protein